MNSTSPSAGFQFSLRDLLVVITCLAVLLGLMVLLIDSERRLDGGGRNGYCKNNLHQIAVAIETFENAHEHYPGYRQQLNGFELSWPMVVAPQLERLDLYEEFTTQPKPPAPYMEILVCPSDPPTKVCGPVLSYVLNAGIADESRARGANGLALDLIESNERIGSAQVTAGDGKSQTLMVSENVQATVWNVADRLETGFVWHDTMRPSPLMRINGGNLQRVLSPSTARPSSYHSGGVNVVFCDTHVRFVSEKINYRVYQHLMTPNSGASDMPRKWRARPLLPKELP